MPLYDSSGAFRGLPATAPEADRVALMQRSVSVSDTAGLREMGLMAYSGIRGVNVSEQTAVSLSAVWACVRVLAGQVAQLPISIIDRATKESQEDHPAYRLVALRPNGYQVAATFWKYMDACVRLRGNGYARIIRNGVYRPASLRPYHPTEVTVIDRRKEENLIYYQVGDEVVPAYDMLHFVGEVMAADGICGRSVLSVASEKFAEQLANQREMTAFYQDGANLQYALKHPGKLSDPAANRLSGTFDQKYTGVGKKRVIVLEEGMGIESIGLPPGDAKFLETANAGVDDICRFFGVPPHMAFKLDRSTNNNIEEQGIGFLGQTLAPSLIAYEQELRIKMLREVEVGPLAFKFNTNALMRTKASERAAYYNTMLQTGALSINEVRALEDFAATPSGDVHLVNGNMISVETAAAQQPRTNTQPDNQPAA